MKKLKIFSIISIVSNAVILIICLLVIFGYGYIWNYNDNVEGLGMISSLFLGWPVCIICALLSVLLIVLKSIFLAKSNNEFNPIILLQDIVLYLLCGLFTLFLIDTPLIEGLAERFILSSEGLHVMPSIAPTAIIILPISTLMTTLTLLSVVVDILIIILTKNIIIIKKKDEISNEQAL